jgi:hypothetical protein
VQLAADVDRDGQTVVVEAPAATTSPEHWQGEALRLFEPASEQMSGQLSMDP